MKRLLLLTLLAAAIISCKKSQSNFGSSSKNVMVGTWNFVSVTTVFRDSTGIRGQAVYPGPQNTYFKFGTDGTWSGKIVSDSLSAPNILGFYKVDSDTSFTLSDTGKYAYSEHCKIYSLTPTSFVYSHTKSTKFNGITPGTIEYLFRLSK